MCRNIVLKCIYTITILVGLSLPAKSNENSWAVYYNSVKKLHWFALNKAELHLAKDSISVNDTIKIYAFRDASFGNRFFIMSVQDTTGHELYFIKDRKGDGLNGVSGALIIPVKVLIESHLNRFYIFYNLVTMDEKKLPTYKMLTINIE